MKWKKTVPDLSRGFTAQEHAEAAIRFIAYAMEEDRNDYQKGVVDFARIAGGHVRAWRKKLSADRQYKRNQDYLLTEETRGLLRLALWYVNAADERSDGTEGADLRWAEAALRTVWKKLA